MIYEKKTKYEDTQDFSDNIFNNASLYISSDCVCCCNMQSLRNLCLLVDLILNRQRMFINLRPDLLDATAVIPSLVYLKLFFSSLCLLVIFSANTLQAAVADTALIHTDTSDIACVAVYSQFSQPGDKVLPPLL